MPPALAVVGKNISNAVHVWLELNYEPITSVDTFMSLQKSDAMLHEVHLLIAG